MLIFISQMKHIFFSLIFLSLTCTILLGQRNENIGNAIKLGDSLRYKDAIQILKQEIKNDPKNANAYYWIGRYSHFLVYDSRPFLNKGNIW